jgi:hypothetical protein
MLTVSMPDGMCSKLMSLLSSTLSSLRAKPTSAFMSVFSIAMIEKPLRPATPVIWPV